MSVTTLPNQHTPAATRLRARSAPRQLEPEPTSDHGLLIKMVAGVLLNVAVVPVMVPFGWAGVTAATVILFASVAALLHAANRLLNDTDEESS